MQSARFDISPLAKALDENRRVFLDPTGKWRPLQTFFKRAYYLIMGNSIYYRDLTRSFTAQMDVFERTAFHTHEIDDGMKLKVQELIKVGNLLREKITTAAPPTQELINLEYRITALKFRAGVSYGGIDRTVERKSHDRLTTLLSNWKKSRLYYTQAQKELNERDKKVIAEICTYKEFVHLIEHYPSFREELFNWSIRDNNQVEIFLEFPAITQRLRSILLASRVGRFAGEILEMGKEDQKTITLRFQVEGVRGLESRKINILDETQRLKMRGGGEYTIAEIFNHFAKKNETVGDFEVFGGSDRKMSDKGILCWNVHKLGYPSHGEYQQISLDDPEWWKGLPVFEVIDIKELEQRTGLTLKEEPWGVAMAKGTRKFPLLDIDKSHGFLGFALRQEDGRYQIFDLGKFAETFPISSLEQLFFLANTAIAKIEYPDSNNFYTDRQTATHARILSEAEGRTYLNLIARDLKKARDGKMIFQMGWENCAYWPQTIFQEAFGTKDNFYKIPLLDTEISQFVPRAMAAFGKSLPNRWQESWVNFIVWLLNYKRGVVIDGEKRSLYNSPFMQGSPQERHHIFCAARLHHLIIEKRVSGTLFGAHGS